MSHVYMIQEQGTQNYKIGIAGQPRKRLMELQVGNPIKLAIVGSFLLAKPSDVERYLHLKLKLRRVRGEWFKLSEAAYSNIFCRLSAVSSDCACCPSFINPTGKTKEPGA